MSSTNGVAAKPSVAQVQLGDETYDVVPQRVGRVKKHLGREIAALSDFQLSGGLDGFVSSSLERTWRILKVLIPDLMPLWEFQGYRSEQAMDEDEFLEDGKEYGPTLPQIVDAVETVMEVNRLDLIKQLGKIVDLDLIRLQVNQMVATAMRESLEAGQTTPSLSTSATPGPDTPSMTSGTTAPTSG